MNSEGLDTIFRLLTEVAALIGIRPDQIGDGVYLGKAKRFAIITATHTPALFGDDEPGEDIWQVDFGVYVPPTERYRDWEGTVRLGMEERGFVGVSYDGSIPDTESDTRHIIFSGEFDTSRT